jgi:hypothetical protein
MAESLRSAPMDSNSNQRPIIIKRKKVIVGGGHHGGAWKVAMTSLSYAVFRRLFRAIWIEARIGPAKRRSDTCNPCRRATPPTVGCIPTLP